MALTCLHNLEILDPEASVARLGAVLVEGGGIVEVLRDGALLPPAAQLVDLGGLALAPGFLDLHLHGELVFAGEEGLPAALERTARALVREGTTGFLATTVCWDDARIEMFVTRCEAAMTHARHGAAALLGVHLEGPWINPAAAGAQPSAAIRPFEPGPGREVLDFGREVIKMVTLAPEVQGSRELLRALEQRSMVASLGHSLARHEDIDAGVAAGMTHVTHLFNAMGPVHHRDPGVAGWALADDRLSCDLICDGVHVHPAMVRTACRAKAGQLLLISDRIQLPAEGTGAQASSFGSGPLHDAGDALRTADGGLAGSNLTLGRALRNAQAFGAMSRSEAVAALTLRPARLLGVEAQRGTLRPGARADFAMLDAEDRVRETWIAGERVYAAE